MNKSLLFSAAALLLCGSVEARNWDFDNWSAETKANLIADQNWSEDEKGSGTIYAGCYWFKAASLEEATDSEGQLVANGVAIKELQGLKITAYGSGGAAIAVDYQTTKDGNNWGPYNGPQYLWFSGTLHITIPQVAPGTTITAGVETHKLPSSGADPRGIDMYVGETKVEWTSGQSGYPTTYEEFTWVVPGEEGGEPVDVTFYQNKGCHVYFLHTDEKDDVIVTEDLKVAYLYDATYSGGWLNNGGLEGDPIFNVLDGSFSATAIDYSTTTLTSAQLNDSLLNFDVVVLGECVSSGNALAKGTFDIVNKVPVLNLKSFFYKKGVWGVGAGVNPSPKSATITVTEDYQEDPIFTNVEMEDGVVRLFDYEGDGSDLTGNLVQGFNLNDGSYFSDDIIMAKTGAEANVNAIHAHGTRNRYMLIPLSSDNMDKLSFNGSLLVFNAVTELAKTKASVQKVSTPIATQAQENLSTTVTLTCGTPGSKIYYTLDGTEPTTASAVYSEPFVVTVDGTVVKAFAEAKGYDPSDVMTATISVLAKLAAPRIQIAEVEGETTITLSTTEDANIYYSFVPVTEVGKATLYSDPITVTEGSTIYAFAQWPTALQSETASKSFGCGGVPAVKDTVAHFIPNTISWGDSTLIYKAGELVGDFAAAVEAGVALFKSSAYYHIGNKALPYYSEEVDYVETVKDGDGNVIKSLMNPDQDSTITHYKKDPNGHYEIFSKKNPGWVIKTDGQVVTTEKTTAVLNVGNGATGYYADEALDLISGGPQCKGLVDFGGKYSGAPYCMSVETTEKVAAPFYIEAYLGSGSNSNTSCGIEIQVSADGETWTALQTLNFSTQQRYWKRTKVHYAEEGEWYVRLAQVGNFSKGQLYDVIIMTTEGVTGIESVAASDALAKNKVAVDLFGRRVNGDDRGQFIVKNGKTIIVR